MGLAHYGLGDNWCLKSWSRVLDSTAQWSGVSRVGQGDGTLQHGGVVSQELVKSIGLRSTVEGCLKSWSSYWTPRHSGVVSQELAKGIGLHSTVEWCLKSWPGRWDSAARW